MDPVTALALACNVITLVEAAIEAAKACKELYEQGSLDVNNTLEGYAGSISTANKELEVVLRINGMNTRLQAVAAEASKTAAELKKLLSQLTLSKHRFTGAFKTTLRTIMKKGSIEKLQKKNRTTGCSIALRPAQGPLVSCCLSRRTTVSMLTL